MKNEIMSVLFMVFGIVSLISSFVLFKRHKKHLRKDSTQVNQTEIDSYNVFSVQERPLNELIEKDKEYCDIILLGIEAYNFDKKCNIIANDCDVIEQITLPNYSEI